MGECFFWYRPTRVVPDQRPLNGRCCCCRETFAIICTNMKHHHSLVHHLLQPASNNRLQSCSIALLVTFWQLCTYQTLKISLKCSASGTVLINCCYGAFPLFWHKFLNHLACSAPTVNLQCIN